MQSAGYYDHSIWEESKGASDSALKKLINRELEGTSVTAVLIGTRTYARRWVRYEIAKSIERGNRVLGIHINSVGGKDGLTKSFGPNPLDYMALWISTDGHLARFTEWSGSQWVWYDDLDGYTLAEEQPAEVRDKSRCLSSWYRTYDWIGDEGYKNFSTWIE